MTELEKLRPIIVDLADASNTVDLNTVNIVILTVPQYNNRSVFDIINIYFDDVVYYTYVVDSLVDTIHFTIGKDNIRKQDYNIYYTIKDSAGNINYSEDKVFHFKNIDERFKLGEPLFPDARENVIDKLTVSTAGGLRVISDYKYIEVDHKIKFHWKAVYTGTDTIINGTEYTSPEITVNSVDVKNGYVGITIPVGYIVPASDIGIGQCYYTVNDSRMQATSPTASIKIVTSNWNDGRLHTYHTTGIARTSPNYPHLRPYNFVNVVGDPGREAIFETGQGVLIDQYNGVDEVPFTFDHTGKRMFRLYVNESLEPFQPGNTDTEEEAAFTYAVSYADALGDVVFQPISFINYKSHDGPIRSYSFNNVAYIDNETPIQVLVVLNKTITSNKISVSVDKNAKINHYSNRDEILVNDYTASFFVYNNVVEENTIIVNIDNSSNPLRLNVNFIDPVKA